MTTLTGVGRLIRSILRRDRVRLLVWTVAITGMTLGSAAGLPAIYKDQAAIDNYVRLFGDNPALIAFAGPGYGFDAPNLGLVLVNETQLFAMIALALMCIFLVNRHTRAEEESERAELIRSNVVGRHAPAAAAGVVIGGANMFIGLLCAIGFIASDYEVTGSLALAASMVLAGLLFAGVAAVAAQLTSSGRATLGISSGVLAVAFIIRAAGDVAGNGLSWLSPIGWAQAVRAYADERWWTLGLCALATALLFVAAFKLANRRDIGSGLLPSRPGRAHAPGWMTKPFGLAFRLQRGVVLGWTVVLFVMGYLYGSIANDIEQMLEENPVMRDMYSQLGEGVSLTDSFLATSMMSLGLLACGFAISSSLRLASEEHAGRAEPILSTATSRWRWSLSHVVIVFLGALATMAAAGLGVGISYAVIANDAGQVPRLLAAALVTVPAVLVLGGVAVALFGLLPSAPWAAWVALGAVVGVGFFGEILSLPDWTRLVSPFEHVPALPAEDLEVLPILLLAGVAAALIVLGLSAFRARDLRTE